MYQTTNISIKYGRTGGDETSEYFVSLKKPMTVGEFMTEWITEQPGEWGYFGIYDGKSIFGNPLGEYSHGKMVIELPIEFLDRPIKKVYGSGGWSRSDFEFEIVPV